MVAGKAEESTHIYKYYTYRCKSFRFLKSRTSSVDSSVHREWNGQLITLLFCLQQNITSFNLETSIEFKAFKKQLLLINSEDVVALTIFYSLAKKNHVTLN